MGLDDRPGWKQQNLTTRHLLLWGHRPPRHLVSAPGFHLLGPMFSASGFQLFGFRCYWEWNPERLFCLPRSHFSWQPHFLMRNYPSFVFWPPGSGGADSSLFVPPRDREHDPGLAWQSPPLSEGTPDSRISVDTARWEPCSVGASPRQGEAARKRPPHRSTEVRDLGWDGLERQSRWHYEVTQWTVPNATWDWNFLFYLSWFLLQVKLASYLSQRTSIPCYIYYLVICCHKKKFNRIPNLFLNSNQF